MSSVIQCFIVILFVTICITLPHAEEAESPGAAQQNASPDMGIDTLNAEEEAQDAPIQPTGVVTGKKTMIKKYGRKMLTQCPEDMEYIIMDYNPKAVYEICIDRYEYPNLVGQMPVTGATWYKAKKLCESKGKYLCLDREWTKACVGLNNWDFGYYNIYDSAKCNVSSDTYKKIGDNPDCKTRNYDVYDMVGNVREWTGGGGVGASGGSYKNGRAARCSKWEPLTLKRGYDDVGFRCCVKVFTGRYGQVDRNALMKAKETTPNSAEEPLPADSTEPPSNQ